ncbi:MAG: hypothetical protein KatS3mg114_1386 [Planctomycetaceae bacterium]|nr:MAG: hypothetical protein KatS3mg114_1386 [Planctomycetaceae bacterium]
MPRRLLWSILSGLLCVPLLAGAADEQPQGWIARILQVGAEGEGHEAAREAAIALQRCDAEILPELITGLDAASPRALNWLRGVFETVAGRAQAAGTLSPQWLAQVVHDRGHQPWTRSLAFQWWQRLAPADAEKFLPQSVDDTAPEIRRAAVAWWIAQAQASRSPDEARQRWRQALLGAVDDDQVKLIAQALRQLGESVDLPRHFGFITRWQVIGPFENTMNVGFDTPYPPEHEWNLSATYAGKLGEVRWQEVQTDHEYGIVDLAKALAPHKGALIYAAAEFPSADRQTVEIRLGTPNAWKLWVNGELVFARDEYHRNMQLDQYAVRVQLQPGINRILLKVCQNEQTEEWAQRWQYQLRVCDLSGRGLTPAGMATTQR